MTKRTFTTSTDAIEAVLEMHVVGLDTDGADAWAKCTCLWTSEHRKVPDHYSFDHPTRVELRQMAFKHLAERIYREGREPIKW